MRDHLGGTVLFIVVGLISLVFVLWGVFPESKYGRSMGLGGDVAVIGGEHITSKELRESMDRDVQQYRALGMELPPELMEQVKAGTLQRLVQQKLMLVEARRLGVQASEQEVRETIQKLPYFQNPDTKKFDKDVYLKLLAANSMSPGEFEQKVRDDLTNERLRSFLEGRIRVTPAEVEREYRITNETRNLEFARFSKDDAIKKMAVAPKEVDAFLADKNKEVQVTSFYAGNNARYNKQEQVCARHILKRFSAGGENEQAAPKAFTDLNPTAANFAKLAEKNSDDPGSKAKGGDLECFPRGMMDNAFEATAFSTTVGKISAPVKSKFGWHYIYVYKKTEPVSIALDKVKRDIAEELIKRERIEEIRKINMASGEEAMKHWPAKGVDSTGPFNGLEGMIPKIGRADEIMRAAFDPKAAIQRGPQLFEAQGGVIVARIKEKKSADMAKLAQEKDKQLQTLKERKLRAFLPAWMEDVRKRTKISVNAGFGGGEM
ncbi:MAG TPA: SurA N-terminal domain-containing protein [Bdellovibrionota bacterium]